MKKSSLVLATILFAIMSTGFSQAKTFKVKTAAGKTEIIGYFAIRGAFRSCTFEKVHEYHIRKAPSNGSLDVRKERSTLTEGKCKGHSAQYYVIRYRGNGKPDNATVSFITDKYDDDDEKKAWVHKYKINQ